MNDTVTFNTNHDANHIISMHVESRDVKYLASQEKNAKKKRLMSERQYKLFVGKALLSRMIAGSQPEYEQGLYDN